MREEQADAASRTCLWALRTDGLQYPGVADAIGADLANLNVMSALRSLRPSFR